MPDAHHRHTPEPSYSQREEHLRELLLQQPAVFLERHVKHLSRSEREAFDPLRGDYEVNHWLNTVQTHAPIHAARHGVALQRNRRLAYMQTGTNEVWCAHIMHAPVGVQRYTAFIRKPP